VEAPDLESRRGILHPDAAERHFRLTRYAPSDDLARDLQEHVKGITAPYKYPRIVDFAAELPKTASGKVRRAALRESG
jgi:acyl-coenzyme A synthetase/AMP-(fatty) acid ligase